MTEGKRNFGGAREVYLGFRRTIGKMLDLIAQYSPAHQGLKSDLEELSVGYDQQAHRAEDHKDLSCTYREKVFAANAETIASRKLAEESQAEVIRMRIGNSRLVTQLEEIYTAAGEANLALGEGDVSYNPAALIGHLKCALRQRTRLLRETLDNLFKEAPFRRVAIAIANENGEILYHNRRTLELFQGRRIRGKNMTEVAGDVYLSQLGKQSFKLGKSHFNATVLPIAVSQNVKNYVLVFRKMPVIKKLEQKLRLIGDEARHLTEVIGSQVAAENSKIDARKQTNL